MELKPKGWSFNPKDREDGEAYLVFAIVAGADGVLTERLVMAAWSETANNWQFEDDTEGPAMPPWPKLEGTVVHVLCWLWVPHIPVGAFYDAAEVWEGLRKQQQDKGRNDNPEDHDNGEYEWDLIDPEED